MEISELPAVFSDQLFLTLHSSSECYAIVVSQTVIVLAIVRSMLQSTALALAFMPLLGLGGLAGIRAARISGLPLGDYATTLVLGSTAGIAAALLVAVLIARLAYEVIALQTSVPLARRRG